MLSAPRLHSARAVRTGLVTGTILLCLALVAFGQRRFRGGRVSDLPIPYDGRFTFVRLKYTTAPGGYWAGPAWRHGYPVAEANLMRIMHDVSYLDPHLDDINVLSLDDPKLFTYPIAYIIEVGWWTMTEPEEAALRAYLQKGGFVIVDDFKVRGWRGLQGGGWEPFAANMRRVRPDARFVEMSTSHPIFHSFFEINSLENFPQAYNSGRPVFRGLFEDNDPDKRLQMIVNYNTDVSQYWEWSARGLRPVPDTNEAYKLGVNYIMYGMMH